MLTRRDFLGSVAGVAALPLLPGDLGDARRDRPGRRGRGPGNDGAAERLARRAREGLRGRLDGRPGRDHVERLDHELDVLARLGHAPAQRFAADVVARARRRGIAIGPGRGAAPGSLVCYALGIAGIDPLAYGLLFERFVNERRPASPLFLALDLCARGRDELVSEVLAAHDPRRVAVARRPAHRAGQIVSYVMWERCQGMGLPEPACAFIRQLDEEHPGRLLRDALDRDVVLRAAVSATAVLVRAIPAALRVEERMGQHDELWQGLHLVFGGSPLPEAGRDPASGWPVVPFDDDEARRRGLGPGRARLDRATMSSMPEGSARRRISRTCGSSRPNTSPVSPARSTRSVAGLGSPPASARDAAWRTVSAGSECGLADEFLDRRNRGAAPVPHACLAPVLASTSGLPLYQEQVMLAAACATGMDLAETDLLRRALGKRRPDELARWRQRFAAGALARGISARDARAIFDLLETHGGYAMNRSHVVASARLSLALAHFKAHAPGRFRVAVASAARLPTSSPDPVA